MRTYKQLATRIGAVAAIATLIATSAFAESRHQNETRGRIDRREVSRQDRSSRAPQSQRSYDRSQSRSNDRGSDRRSDRSQWRNDNRNYDRTPSRSYNNDRSYGYRGGNDHYRGDSRYGSRQPYYAHGRVSHIAPYGGGFRVWIGGAPYPFFVPRAFWNPSRFRVGVSINLGGYYNPLGYYDYYDRGYYGAPAYSQGVLRGTVESVDYRRGTFVIRNEASGSFVTVDSNRRGSRDVRPGDYVEVQGDWTRSGYFEAYDVALLDDGQDYYRR